jgi:Ribbon-helix-helix protein, copG family
VAKVLVSIDDRLLERLDREADARGVSRSALIAELAAKGLGEPLGPGADPAVHEAIERARQLFSKYHDPVDSTQIIREMRDNAR